MVCNEYTSCNICPRSCKADRNHGETGFCRQKNKIRIGRASLHHWEEPCISGKDGSGTVFFSGCTLLCCYCQNYKLSHMGEGVEITEEQLCDIFLSLEEQGAHNINLVTAEHFAPGIREAVIAAKKRGLSIPVILNSSGYVSIQTLELLKDVIDIFLVDFKYMDDALASTYSLAKDYVLIAKNALKRMAELCPKLIFDDEGMLKSGVIVRHLCLPGHTEDSKRVIEYIYSTYADSVRLSIMSQYTPAANCGKYKNLQRKLSEKEYDDVIDFCLSLGIEDAYIQEGEAASESFIPEFGNEYVKIEKNT